MTKPELIRKVEFLLKHKNIELPKHAGAKEGLTKALELLKSGEKDLSAIVGLSTTQARAIAKFAIDFNNLQDDGKFFTKLGEVIEEKRSKVKLKK